MAVSRGRRSEVCLGDNTGRAHSTGAVAMAGAVTRRATVAATEKTSVCLPHASIGGRGLGLWRLVPRAVSWADALGAAADQAGDSPGRNTGMIATPTPSRHQATTGNQRARRWAGSVHDDRRSTTAA